MGRYEIVSLLGAGGMGEVYAARDSNLGRQVALKILPPQRTNDPERVARFVREAHASSALNHPAIVSVHDAGSDGNVHFLAMELIEGEALSDWMRKNRNPARAIEVMAQVAEGLARAHANGIVHRDLKPENIMVSREGYAKIVDFGVAKLTERTSGNRAHTGVTTPTSRIGTTAYMSPEQVEGRTIDHRADVFAFGTVLYEAIAGRNPFASEQYADTLHNIVHLDPPMQGVPRALQRIVRRCLEKDPELRYHSLKDAALDLREAVIATEAPKKRTRWATVIAAIALALIAAAWFVIRRQGASDVREMKMTRLTNVGKVSSAAISPDGNYLVYAAREGDMQALYVKQIATGTTTRIAEPAPAYYYDIEVSPDGNYIYYVITARNEPNVADIYTMPLLGGQPRRVASDTEFSYSLSPDGTRIAFRRFSALDREHRLTVAKVDGSGEEVVLRKRPPEFIVNPVWSPDGDAITYIGGVDGDRESSGLFEVTLADRFVKRIPAPKFPSVGSYAALADGSGYLVSAFDRDQPPQIWFVPRGEATGRKITNDISEYESVSLTADSTAVVAVRGVNDSNIYTMRIGSSALTPVTSGVGNYVGGSGVKWLSNDEVVYTGFVPGGSRLYAAKRDGGTPRQILQGMSAWEPGVSPDGKQIVFTSDASSSTRPLWIMDANGDNKRQLTTGLRAGSPSFTPDGRSVVYLSYGETQFAWRISVDGGTPEQLTNIPTSRAMVSPDGKWLLCRLRSTDPKKPLWRTAIVPMDKKGPPRFFDVPYYGGPPRFDWHPKLEAFVYLDWKGGVSNLWLQDIAGGEPRQLTFFESGEIFTFGLSPDGTSIALARGNPSSDAVLIRDFR